MQMKCAWQAYLNLLPQRMRQEVDFYGRDTLQELRMRIGRAPLMCFQGGNRPLATQVKQEDIAFVINAASEYSPWAARTVRQGFLTGFGGHRIGICGIYASMEGTMGNITQPTSLCIRVARDFEGIAGKLAGISDSMLLIGPPGSGKTTLLRDLIRMKGCEVDGCVAVVDEREELFPHFKGQACFDPGIHTDVLSGCPKSDGIDALLRSMNPSWIAVDEITREADCNSLLKAGWCGVRFIVTAHAGSVKDLLSRPVYRPLIINKLFDSVVVLRRDKSWTLERMYE
jgi:stage III sporulation protein AA